MLSRVVALSGGEQLVSWCSEPSQPQRITPGPGEQGGNAK